MFENLRLLACIASNNTFFPVPGNNAVLWRFQTHAQDKGVNMAAKLRRKEKLHQFSTMFNTEFHVNFNQLCFTDFKVYLCNIVCISHACDILNQYWCCIKEHFQECEVIMRVAYVSSNSPQEAWLGGWGHSKATNIYIYIYIYVYINMRPARSIHWELYVIYITPFPIPGAPKFLSSYFSTHNIFVHTFSTQCF
jgi:hypothetical protein